MTGEQAAAGTGDLAALLAALADHQQRWPVEGGWFGLAEGPSWTGFVSLRPDGRCLGPVGEIELSRVDQLRLFPADATPGVATLYAWRLGVCWQWRQQTPLAEVPEVDLIRTRQGIWGEYQRRDENGWCVFADPEGGRGIEVHVPASLLQARRLADAPRLALEVVEICGVDDDHNTVVEDVVVTGLDAWARTSV